MTHETNMMAVFFLKSYQQLRHKCETMGWVVTTATVHPTPERPQTYYCLSNEHRHRAHGRRAYEHRMKTHSRTHSHADWLMF